MASGWSIVNQSSPVGLTDWFQGNPAVFTAQAGAANSYIAANFEAAGASGNISDWLLTPVVSFTNGDTLSFFTRSDGNFADKLEVRYSTVNSTDVGSTATSVGAFTNLLLSVNPTSSATGYPTAWTQVNTTFSGLAGTVTGRLAFRYVVTDTAVNGNYIGIDTFNLSSAVPEPSSIFLMITALGAGAGLYWRKRNS